MSKTRTITIMLAALTVATSALWLPVTAAHAQAPAQPPAQAPAAPAAPESAEGDDEGALLSDLALTRAAIQVRRQALVTAGMDLDGKEAAAFWPLYRDYRVAMAKVNDRFGTLVTTYLQNYDTLTDQMATKLVDDYLAIERARNAVKTEYVKKFRTALPSRKVARFFQIDNKLDAYINAELARAIPLAR